MEIFPSFTEFKKLSKNFTLIPVWTEILSDIETPVSAFLKIKKGKYNFLLESVEQEEKIGRYSFLGIQPKLIFKSKDKKIEILNTVFGRKTFFTKKTPLDELKTILDKYHCPSINQIPKFFGGFVGYISYDFIRFIEKIPSLTKDDLNLPDTLFLLTNNIVVFDHFKRKIILIANIFLPEYPNYEKAYIEGIKSIKAINKNLGKKLYLPEDKFSKKISLNFKSNFSKKSFMKNVLKAKQYIKDGDIIQVVLSQRWETKIHTNPFNIYRTLRSVNPSPYMFYFEADRLKLIGSSPEILVKLEENVATLRPIAGTRKRGKDEKEEEKMENELITDEKEKAEHIMLVDLGRNDLGRVCKHGTVKVTELMKVEKYSHVMHLVSNVVGKLAPGKNMFDLLKSSFPAGTVTGAPKIRSMEIIEELEPTRRGPYAGAVGYFSFNKNMDFCITIRTIFIKDNTMYFQAGAGIVADSIPEREYKETLNKAKGLIEAYKLSKRI